MAHQYMIQTQPATSSVHLSLSITMSSLWRILSDTSSIVSSSLLHFTTMYLIFIFPDSLFDAIDALLRPPSPFNPKFEIRSIGKSELLYGIALLVFNISLVSSVTSTIFRGFHRKPIKLYPSLKSFLPLLPTKLAYSMIFVATLSAFGICAGVVFYVMVLLGLEIKVAASDAASTCFTALLFMTLFLFAAVFAYLCAEWCWADAIVVVEESEDGLEGSSGSLVMGMRSVAFVMITVLGIVQGILSALFSVLAGRSARISYINDEDVRLVVYGVLFTALSLFCVVHCKAFNGELEDLELEYFPSDEKKKKKLRKIQLPDVHVDKV